MDIDEKIRFIESALMAMAQHTHPFLASIVGVESDGSSGEHVGSALRVLLGGRRSLITAAHVIHQARSGHPRFAATAVRGGPPYELHGPPAYVDQERDLAAYVLPDDYPSDGIAFFPGERSDVVGDKLATDFLFVHGFPAVRSRFSALAGGLLSRSFPYGAMLRDDDLPDDLTTSQFAVDFDPENLQRPDGKPTDWLDPHGLDGSPVWRIGASGLPVDEWTPEHALLVGVITQWRPGERILVATRWQHVLEMVGPP